MAKKKLSFFMEKLSVKDFEKKYIKRIFTEKEKTFLKSFYKEQDGVLHWSKAPDKKDLKHLKKLKKDIKKNAGFIKTAKLGMVGVVLGGAVVFNFLFLDSIFALVTRNALESVFDAKVDIQGANLDLFAMDLSFESIAVADKSDPMFNLFVLEDMEADLVSSSLFRGNINIRTMKVGNILWSVPRKESGSLNGSSEDLSEGSESLAAKKDAQAMSLSFDDFDAKKLVDQQWEKLETPVYIETMQEDMAAAKKSLEAKVENFESRVAALQKKAQSLRLPNVSSAADIPKLQSFVKQVQSVKTEASQLQKEGQSLYTEVKSTADKYKNVTAQVKEKTQTDLRYLKSFVQMPEAGSDSLVSSIVENLFGDKGVKVLDYALMAYEASKKASENKESTNQEPVAKEGKRNPGLNYFTEVLDEPAFLLQKAELGIGDGAFSGNLENLTSHPDILKLPTTFSYKQSEPLIVDVSGLMDLRSAAQEVFDITYDIDKLPLDLSPYSQFLGLDSLSGRGLAEGSMQIDSEGVMAGKADLVMNDLKYQKLKENLVGDLTTELFAKEKRLSAELQFKKAGNSWKVSGRSDMDQKLSSLAGDLINEKLKASQGDLEKELSSRLGMDSVNLDGPMKDLNSLVEDSLAGKNMADSANSIADNHINNANKKIAALKKQAEQQAQDQAKNLLDDVSKKLPF